MANSVDNAALLDSVITGKDTDLSAAQLPGLRLGIPKDYFYQNFSPEVKENAEAVLLSLRQAGVQLIDVQMPDLEKINNSASSVIAMHEFTMDFPKYLQQNNIGVSFEEVISAIASEDVKMMITSLLADPIPLAVYDQAINEFRPKLQALYANAFEAYQLEALLVPATPCAARPIVSSDLSIELNGEQVPTLPTYIRNVDPSSVAGIPSLAIPAGPAGTADSGLPVGMCLDGPLHSDRRLFEIAKAIEAHVSN